MADAVVNSGTCIWHAANARVEFGFKVLAQHVEQYF